MSRHLNRRVSRPIARLLSRTPVTPNQVSIASLGIALTSFFSFAYGAHIAGALLAQTSSVVDGIDGDLARISGRTSAYGGFLDAILDRYADALIVLGLTIWAVGAGPGLPVWITGFWALAGTFVVTYTRARIERVHENAFDQGFAAAATRDVRLLIVMVGGLVGQGLATLVLLALLTNGVVLLRLLFARRILAGR